MSSDYRFAWNQAYQRNQNALFWPNEHLVRFVATRLRRRLTLDEYWDVADLPPRPKVLDLGCGMGRHLAYLTEMGFAAYGIDLSEVAISHATDWLVRLGVEQPPVVSGSVDRLPWPDGTFEAAVSHAVLDSMPFGVAVDAVSELRRVTRRGGWIYVDLIAAPDRTAGEEVVTGPHETGTIQSYFDLPKLERLLAPFMIEECYLATTDAVIGERSSARWHVICR